RDRSGVPTMRRHRPSPTWLHYARGGRPGAGWRTGRTGSPAPRRSELRRIFATLGPLPSCGQRTRLIFQAVLGHCRADGPFDLNGRSPAEAETTTDTLVP